MNKAGNHTRLEKLLLEAARVFNSTLEYEELMELVLKMIVGAVSAEAALVFRVDHSRSDMKIRYMHCSDCLMNEFTVELGSGVIGWVANYKEPVIINDAANDERIDDIIRSSIGVEMKSIISVPLIGKGQMIGVIEAINSENSGFTDEDLDTLVGLSNQIAVAIDNANLYRTVKREALIKDLLYDIGNKLSGSLTLDEVLKEIMASVRLVVDYDAGGVFIVDETEVLAIYSEGYDADCIPHLHSKVGKGLVGTAIEQNYAVIVPDVTNDPRYINCRVQTNSEMVVPIVLSDRVIGSLNLESNRRDAFDSNDTAALQTFAAQAAISIERARMHQKLLESQKIDQQLEIAREIQTTFLPKKAPSIPHYDIHGRNIPSGQVGGDYFDFIEIVSGQIGIAIADVVGKGIPASLIMASVRASLIAEIRNNYSIRTICEKVNALLVESLQPGDFVTAVYGVLDSKNHIFTFSNCGHNQPILLRSDDTVEYLKEGGPIFGVTHPAEFEERPIFLNPGDLIVMYTDGVTEVFDKDGNEFGPDNLIELIKANRDLTSAEISQKIIEAVNAFAADDQLFDDLTMIVVKRLE